MAGAKLSTHSAPTGPERIGAALKERWREIDGQAIGAAKQRLDDAFNSVVQPIVVAAYEEALGDRGRITQAQKRELAVALRARIGGPVVKIDLLCREIWRREQEELLRAIERQEEKDLPEYSFGRPMSSAEHGKRLQEAVEMCVECLRTAPNPLLDPHGPVILKYADICFRQILSELQRLKILGVCACCGKTMFPAIASKLYCSMTYEGRDCCHRQCSRRYDAKRRARQT